MHSACDGALWLATDQGVARLTDDAWSVQFTDLAGKIAGVDAAGRLWVIGEDSTEIAAWNGVAWTTYGAEAGWVSMSDFWYQDFMTWGQCDRAGRFWLATTQDVRVFDGARWTVFTSQALGMGEVPDPNGCAPSFQMTILKSTGDVWVGECDWAEGACGGQGTRWFDGATWHGADSPVSQGCVAAIAEDAAGDVWLGGGSGVWRYAPASGDWTRFSPPKEAPFNYRSHGAVLSLAADPFDRLWVTELLCGPASCDAHALYYVRAGVWTLLPGGEAPPYILDLRAITDASGASWLFGDAIYRLTETDIQPVLPRSSASAAVDAAGRVWFVFRDYPHSVLCTIETDK